NPDEGESHALSLTALGTIVPRGIGGTANGLIAWVEAFPDGNEPDDAGGAATVLLVGRLKVGSGFEPIGEPIPGARILYSVTGTDRRGIYAPGSKRHHILVTEADVLLANSETSALSSLLDGESRI